MSQNSQIVDYFFDHFKSNQIDKIHNFVSPNFVCYVNNGLAMNFEQLAERMKVANSGAVTKSEGMTSEDDVHFSTEFELQTPNENNEIISAFGFSEIKVSQGLIERINVHYYTSDEEMVEFREMMNNNAMVNT